MAIGGQVSKARALTEAGASMTNPPVTFPSSVPGPVPRLSYQILCVWALDMEDIVKETRTIASCSGQSILKDSPPKPAISYQHVRAEGFSLPLYVLSSSTSDFDNPTLIQLKRLSHLSPFCVASPEMR